MIRHLPDRDDVVVVEAPTLPEPLIAEADLARDYAHLKQRANELVDKIEAQPSRITTERRQATVQDLIKEIDSHTQLIEATRGSVKAPFLAAGKVVDGFFKQRLTQPLRLGRDRLADIGQDYLERKAARARALLSSREAASARSADLARTRSPVGGSLGTLADGWEYEIIDPDALQAERLWEYVAADAKEAAVRAYMRINAPKHNVANWNPLAGVRMAWVSRAKYY